MKFESVSTIVINYTSLLTIVIVVASVVLNILIIIKINNHLDWTTLQCIPIEQSLPSTIDNYALIDWRNKSTFFDNRIKILVVHDTEIETVDETLEVLNRQQLSTHYIVAKNGTVDEWKRAYQAGESGWNGIDNINDVSIGIEIVNSGDESFPIDQIIAVADLASDIIQRYNIQTKNIVAHADIAPTRKQDVSEYFDWKLFYDRLNRYTRLYESKLTIDQQNSTIFVTNHQYNQQDVILLQQRLQTYGYPIADSHITGIFDNYTQDIVAAFNRHFCPEIFQKEHLVNGTHIFNQVNRYWYGISQERLIYLLANS